MSSWNLVNNLQKKFYYTLTLFILVSGILRGDWNETFDQQSLLVQSMPAFQNQEYLDTYNSFIPIRDKLLKDSNLINTFANSIDNEKFNVTRLFDNLIIKKRYFNKLYELYVWELSYLMGSGAYMVPSFPIEMGGKKVLVQKMRSFVVGRKLTNPPKKALAKVVLGDYWKSLIQVYLIGHSDLANRNIGIGRNGELIYFDNEACLTYTNLPRVPHKNERSFRAGFMSQSLDWPQFREPLDKKTAESLRDFVNSMSNFENDLATYMAYRGFNFPKDEMLYRLEKVRQFNYTSGATFRDFYGSLFPKMSPGLEKLNKIVGGIVKQKVDVGMTLYFMTRWIVKYDISAADKALINEWVNTYID